MRDRCSAELLSVRATAGIAGAVRDSATLRGVAAAGLFRRTVTGGGATTNDGGIAAGRVELRTALVLFAPRFWVGGVLVAVIPPGGLELPVTVLAVTVLAVTVLPATVAADIAWAAANPDASVR
ncbi:MAG TPA: hypothetical protein VGH11_17965 [Jatrophihabitans sp.]